jgi:type II secretory pathway pseudopilin PulG
MVAPLALRARLRHEEDGISLVEVLVAIVVLGLIMGAMARTLTSSLFSVQGQQAQVRATALVQELLEEAAGVAWADLGLCKSEAIGMHPTGDYTHGDGTTEPLVLIPDSSSLCDPLDDAPVRAERTHDRDGIEYRTTTVVSWTDEDGLGSPDDLKHVMVLADWTQRGEARTTLAETFLAPNALEAVLATEIIHDGSQTYTYIDKDTGLTESDVVLRAVAVRPQSGIMVRWRDSNGDFVSRAMDPVTSDGLVWERLIPEGSPDFDINRLANGETLFEFSATDRDNATVFEAFDRGLFLLEPDGLELTLGGPDAIGVDAAGSLCGPVTLSVDARGMLSSDILDVVWSEGFGTASLASSPDDDPTGALFEIVHSSGVISPPPEDASKTVRANLTGTRVADNETVTAAFDIPVVVAC